MYQFGYTDRCNCALIFGTCLDIVTPSMVKLSAFYKRSFAYVTVNTRMPLLLTKFIDNLIKNKTNIVEEYGPEALEDLKTIISDLSKLKFEIRSNKPMTPIELNKPDAKIYNSFIKRTLDTNCNCLYYNAVWLFVECYMYRRIYQSFLKSTCLRQYDYFAQYKKESLSNALPLIIMLGNMAIEYCDGSWGREELKPKFIRLLKLNLWANKCDLSQSNGEIVECNENLIQELESLDSNILCDDSELIYDALCTSSMFEIVDIILDNAGSELFMDFCLADFLICHKFAKTVRFFVKDFPWFISDTKKTDIDWMFETLAMSDNKNLSTLMRRWMQFRADNVWNVAESNFWTTHVPFCEMFDTNEQLFRKLAQSKCSFYKGDLNYRKLLGDRKWIPTTPFEEALEGFNPSRLCALRTLKSDLICGLKEGVESEMQEKDPEWLLSGAYGLIQFSSKVKKLS